MKKLWNKVLLVVKNRFFLITAIVFVVISAGGFITYWGWYREVPSQDVIIEGLDEEITPEEVEEEAEEESIEEAPEPKIIVVETPVVAPPPRDDILFPSWLENFAGHFQLDGIIYERERSISANGTYAYKYTLFDYQAGGIDENSFYSTYSSQMSIEWSEAPYVAYLAQSDNTYSYDYLAIANLDTREILEVLWAEDTGAETKITNVRMVDTATRKYLIYELGYTCIGGDSSGCTTGSEQEGVYAYDLTDRDTVYIGEGVSVTDWVGVGEYVALSNFTGGVQNGKYQINLEDGEKALRQESTNDGKYVITYFIDERDTRVELVAEPGSSKAGLYFYKSWGEIPVYSYAVSIIPFSLDAVIFAPDRSKLWVDTGGGMDVACLNLEIFQNCGANFVSPNRSFSPYLVPRPEGEFYLIGGYAGGSVNGLMIGGGKIDSW